LINDGWGPSASNVKDNWLVFSMKWWSQWSQWSQLIEHILCLSMFHGSMITAYRAHSKCFSGLKLKHQPKFPKKTSCSHIAKTMCRHWFSAVFDQRLRPW
jgi:hypothetical protein